jgi:hypothetical protein
LAEAALETMREGRMQKCESGEMERDSKKREEEVREEETKSVGNLIFSAVEARWTVK